MSIPISQFIPPPHLVYSCWHLPCHSTSHSLTQPGVHSATSTKRDKWCVRQPRYHGTVKQTNFYLTGEDNRKFNDNLQLKIFRNCYIVALLLFKHTTQKKDLALKYFIKLAQTTRLVLLQYNGLFVTVNLFPLLKILGLMPMILPHPKFLADSSWNISDKMTLQRIFMLQR